MFGIFGKSRKEKLHDLRQKLRSVLHHEMVMSRRMSYLETRNKEVFKYLTSKDNPVVMLRENDKTKIEAKIDKWLDGLE